MTGGIKKKYLWVSVVIAIILGIGGTSYGQENNNPILNYSSDFHRSSLTGSEKTVTEKTPSKARAFLLSFILPGTGEYYAGSKKMATIFLGTEVLLWTTYFSFRIYGHWKKHDYQLYAVSHAGISPAGKDQQYFVDIENYHNIREYNEAKLRQRNVGALYPENESYRWQWDSETSRLEYEKLRIKSDHAYSGSLFVIGGILANHIISGIDALRIAKKRERMSENRVRFGVVGLPEGGVVVSLWKKF